MATTSATWCWPSASKVTTQRIDGTDRAYSKPVCSAAPWPRLTGCRTTTAPAAAAASAPPSEEPSSTQTTCGKVRRTSRTTSPMTALLVVEGDHQPDVVVAHRGEPNGVRGARPHRRKAHPGRWIALRDGGAEPFLWPQCGLGGVPRPQPPAPPARPGPARVDRGLAGGDPLPRLPEGRANRATAVACSSGRTGHAAGTPPPRTARRPPIGAQLLYLALAAGPPPEPRDERDAVVLMPVHGIQTQRVRGDHGALAQDWRDAEGPATACLYASDAADPDILRAYRDAGHRVVVLGDRLDPDFLWRLWTMLGRARRVVSNRLSTPVFYAAHLGADIGVYGDALRIEGEEGGQNDRVRDLWPELHAEHVDPAVARDSWRRELGIGHVRGPGRARAAARLGPSHRRPGRRVLDHLGRPAGSGQPAPQGGRAPNRRPDRRPPGSKGCPSRPGCGRRRATCPRQLPRTITPAGHAPRADRGARPG